MKIAFIVSEFPLLPETFILNQITGLIDLGHKVDIFAPIQGDLSIVHEDVKKYNLLKTVCYYGERIPEKKIVRFKQSISLITKYIHKNPIPLFNALNIFKYGRKAASLGLLFQIIPFIEKGPYDIVHCHFGPIGKIGLFFRDIGALKGKIVTTFHGFDMSAYIKKNGKDTYKNLFEKGDLFLTISERWKHELINLGVEEEKILVHRMGVDTRKFTFSERNKKDNTNIQLLTVARLVKKKGVKYGIQAVAEVLKRYPGIEYKIVGDGPLMNDLANLINALKINNNVKLIGWRNQEDIVKLMKDSDIMLAPSVTTEEGDQEGIPVVLMEALALGLPVISTYHSGIPELVQDGISGCLVQERDVNALSEELEHLIKCQELWAKMGRSGRDYVENYYNIDKLNEQLVGIFKELVR